jgi:uncharacterized membrane protein
MDYFNKKNYVKCESCGDSIAPQMTYPLKYKNIYLILNACLYCMLEHNEEIKKIK